MDDTRVPQAEGEAVGLALGRGHRLPEELSTGRGSGTNNAPPAVVPNPRYKRIYHGWHPRLRCRMSARAFLSTRDFRRIIRLEIKIIHRD